MAKKVAKKAPRKKAAPKKAARKPAAKKKRPVKRKGRKSKFTYETVDKICNFLRSGNTNKVACICAGVVEQTFYNWVNDATEAQEKGKATPLQIYFLESITRAREQAEAILVQRVFDASARDWRAAMALIERRNPDDWGDRLKLQRLGKDGKPVDEEVPRVLVVPPHIDDIHEWSKRAKKRVEKARDPANVPE